MFTGSLLTQQTREDQPWPWGAWNHANWSSSKKVTLDNANVNSDLDDAPVLLAIDSDSDMSDAQADASDIRVTLGDQQTLIPHEIETWSGGGGSAVTARIWCRVSLTAASSTDLYVWWGNSAASAREHPHNVWSADGYFLGGVWHWHDDFADSSESPNDATNSGTTDVAGLVGDGQEWAGSSASDYVTADTVGVVTDKGFVCSAWIKIDDKSDDRAIWSNDVGDQCWYDAGNDAFGFLLDSTIEYGTTSPNTGEWYLVSLVYDQSNVMLRVNGVEEVSTSINATDTLGQIYWGSVEGSGKPHDGLIDQPVLHERAYSLDYDTWHYHNLTASDYEQTWSSLGADTTLIPSSMTASTEVADTSITQTHNLQPAPLMASAGVEQTAMSQLHNLFPPGMLAGVDLEASGLTQSHGLSGASMEAVVEMEDAALGKVLILQPASMSAEVEVSDTSVTQVHGLAPEDIAAVVELEAAGLSQAHVVQPVSMEARTRMEEASLLQTHILTPAAVEAIVEMESVSAARLARGYLVVRNVVVAPMLMAEGEIEPSSDN